MTGAMNSKYYLRAALIAPLLTISLLGPTVVMAGSKGEAVSRASAAEAQQERPWLYHNSDVPIDQAWLFGVLPNGLRYAIRNNSVPPGQVSIRVRIDAGSLMEREHEQGFAHFMEHLTFRGSKYVPDGESKRLWQRLGVSFGSDSNARTTPISTTYALDLPDASPEGLAESIKILAGMMTDPNIVPAAVEAERAVVLAEMREGKSAASRIGDASRALYFAGQPLGSRSPIGTPETLGAATAQALAAFHSRWYRPENAVIAVSGDADPRLIEQLLKAHFSAWKGKGKAAPHPDFGAPDPDAPETAVFIARGLPVNLSLAWLRPWAPKADTIVYNQRKLADMIALEMINRRLEQAARRGDASFLQASVNVDDISRSANATFVSVVPIDENWEKALADVRAIIEDAKKTPVSEAEIEREYVQFDTSFAVSVENQDTEASAKQVENIVGAVDIRETTVTPKAGLEIFRSARSIMTPAYMLEATRRMFAGDARRAMVVLNAPQPNAEGRLVAALNAPVEAAKDVRVAARNMSMDDLPKLGASGKPVSREPIGVLGVETISYDNGVKLMLFANRAETEKVRINVRFGNGLLGLSPKKAQPTWAANYVIPNDGIGSLDQGDIDDIVNGRRLGFNFGIDENAFEMSAVTRPADYKDQLRLFASELAFPGWQEGPVARAKAGLLSAYDAYATTPNAVLGRDLGWLLRNKDMRFRTPDKQEIAALTPEQFRRFWAPILQSGPIEVQIFGDVDAQEAIDAVGATFGALPVRKAMRIASSSRKIGFPKHNKQPLILHHRGDKDQAAAVMAWPTGTGLADVKQARQMEILAQIISDRLFEKLRAVDGAAYSPNASSDWPLAFKKGEGYLAVISQLKPERVAYFYSLIRTIVADLAANPISDDELRRTLAPTSQLLARASTGNAFWMDQLEGGTHNPAYIGAARSIARDLLSVNAQDLRALAAQYLVDSKSYSVVVLPEE